MAYRSCLGVNPAHLFGFTTIIFILSTPFIGAGSLSQTWDCNNCYYCIPAMFYLDTWAPISHLPLNLSSFLCLSLQYLFKFIALLYYCSVLLRRYSASMSFLLIVLFILFLNPLINSLYSCPLLLIIFLNFWTNSSIVFLSCSIFSNSTTFIVLLFSPLNFSFKFDKNFSTIT